MAIEPTSIQRDRMLSFGKSKLTLIQFLTFKYPEDFNNYLAQTKQSAIKEGGSRIHQLIIDQVLAGGEMPYQYLTVDNYPSSLALLQAHEATRDIRQKTLIESYAILVKPNPLFKKVAKGLGFLSPFLTNLLNTGEIKEITDYSDIADPETGPYPETVQELKLADQDHPFYMMNLDQFSPRNKQRTGGKDAYNQYSARILPYLVSVGGYPDIYGKILGTYIGDQKSELFNTWHDFALVYYPSRTHFLRLMTNTPRGAAEIRKAGLKKVVLMPCSKLKPHSLSI